MGAPFLKLDDVILPPPLGPLVATLVVLGTWQAGRLLAGRWRRPALPDALEEATCFVAAAATTAGLAHAIAWAGVAMVALLRVLGAGLMGLGAWRAFELARGAPRAGRDHLASWRARPVLERVGAALAAITVVGLWLGALGPPTDADSLDYHLGVPLDWLRHGGAYPRPDWYHARLIGLGESLNLLGLALGSEQQGAAYQAAGLLVAVVAVAALARTPGDRVLAALLVAAVPAMAFLVPNQKPMLLPSAGMAAGLVLLIRERARLSLASLTVGLACVALAVGSKTSFILSGAVVGGVVLVLAARGGWTLRALGVGALVVTLMPGQVWARTWAFYGDPISPFLERFRPGADPGVVNFATYLRHAGAEPTLHNYLRLPWDLVVPSSFGAVSVVLGVGVWGLVLAGRARGTGAWLALAAAAAAVIGLALGQLAPRFLLDSYLWASAAVVCAEAERGKRVLLAALGLQGALAACMAWFAALTLTPGSLSLELRSRVMDRAAFGAAEARWMDQVLPPEAVVAAPTRAHALLPRPFVLDDQPVNRAAAERATPEQFQERLASWLKSNRATVWVGSPPETGPVAACSAPLAGPARFKVATRNPINRAGSFDLEAWQLEWSRPGCAVR